MGQPVDKGATCNEAAGLIGGDRAADYGDVVDDYRRVTGIFREWTGHKLTVADGIKFMICVKMAREAHKHKHDNAVDAVGYWDLLNHAESRRPDGMTG